jgi:2-succinyl-6-hydroxy-2,4-cyclohexadiene-1-carboxylate synthase
VPAERLASTSRGAGPPIVLVHGFTQTSNTWDHVAKRLAARHTVITVDLPGHGASDEVRADVSTAADLLGWTAGRATYVGYSMGGRVSLQLAVTKPDLVDRLVLVSATAGIDDPGERADRRHADEQLAASIERDGLNAFLDRWLALPLFATLPPDSAGLAERRRNTADGLASSLRLAGTGTQDPLWEWLGQLVMPVLVVAGARDAKYVALAERMAQLIPGATYEAIEGAGHAVHLEQPDEFVRALESWIAR